jgi:hypothetical protein
MSEPEATTAPAQPADTAIPERAPRSSWGRNGHTHNDLQRVHTAVRLPPDMVARLDQLAQEHSVPRSDVIRGAIARALDAGVAGTIAPMR